ncbi:MAG: cell division protein FtsQ/DivIB [Patescibacteria group bacterium]
MDYQGKKIKKDFLAAAKKRKKTSKKDYQIRKLDNPFFNRRAKREEKVSNNLKVALISLCALLIILFWFFLYSPIFVIKKIEIKGITRINANEINNLVFGQGSGRRGLIFKQSNIFIFSAEELEAKIQSTYNFAQIKTTKKIPNTIILNVSERPCTLIWENTSNSCYFIDQEGYLIKEIGVQEADRNKLPVISDERGVTGDGNKINLDRQYLDFMLELYQKIGATGLKVDKFVIDKNPDTVRANLKDGPFLMFSLKEDLNKQLNKLITIRQEKLKDNFKNIKYFDLRYGDKVYYIDNQEAGK